MSHQEHNVGSFAHLFQHCWTRFANKINTKAKSLKRTEVIIVSFNFLFCCFCTPHICLSVHPPLLVPLWRTLRTTFFKAGLANRASQAACDSLRGFTRLLRKYQFYHARVAKFCTNCSPWTSGCDVHTRDATYTRIAWKRAWWLSKHIHTQSSTFKRHTCLVTVLRGSVLGGYWLAQENTRRIWRGLFKTRNGRNPTW